jgi:hypothetical protein
MRIKKDGDTLRSGILIPRLHPLGLSTLCFFFLIALTINTAAQEEGDVVAEAMRIPLSTRLFLGDDKSLVESIGVRFSTSLYTYGGSNSSTYQTKLQGRLLPRYLLCNVVLASAGKTDVTILASISRDGVETLLGENGFRVASASYYDYVSLLELADYPILKDDVLSITVRGTGSDFGIYHGLNYSFIKGVVPDGAFSEALLAERTKCIEWILSMNAFHASDLPAGAPEYMLRDNEYGIKSSAVLKIIQELDVAILHGENIGWNIGARLLKQGKAARIEWKDEVFRFDEITTEKAKAIGLEGYSIQTLKL